MEEQSKKNEYLSFKELLYFKEEIFHTLKEFEKKISEKTKESLVQFNTKIEETNLLINKYKNETNIFLTKEDFQKEKKEIIKESSNLKYFNDKFNELEIQISALRKDFNDSCFKYDKIFIDQLTLPGIIGEKCKYKGIRDYIKHNIDEMSRISSLN
jgi:glucan-binding YG repeat protein